MNQVFLKFGSAPLLTLAMLAASANCAHGGIVACGTTPAAAITLTTLGTGVTNGCAEYDLSYTSLGATGNVGTTTNISLYSTGTANSGNTIGPVDLYFKGFTTGGGVAGTETGTVTSEVTANTGGTYTGGTYPKPTVGIWNITGLQLDPTIAPLANVSVIITESFCLNATQATVGGNCTAANAYVLAATYGVDSATAVFTCTVNSASCGTTGSVLFSQDVLDIATSIQVAIKDTANHGNIGGAVTDVENIFTENAVPEPASFGLMGLALVGLGVGFKYRNQRP